MKGHPILLYEIRMPTKKRGGAQGFSVIFAGREAAENLRNRGNTLTAPSVTYQANSGEDLYTLVIWDPDAPNPSFLHWLVVNIPEDRISEGTVIQPYHPPTPPSGIHRYYIELYKQTRGPIHPSVPSRTGFSIADFATKNGLQANGQKMIKVQAS